MKKIAIIAACAALLSSCGGLAPFGVIYNDSTLACEATGTAGNRVGKAKSVNYLGLVGIGDSSLQAAKKNGGLSTISTHDVHVKNILGIITEKTTIVTGN